MRLLIVGAGSIAREVALAMATQPFKSPLEVRVTSRDYPRADWISTLGNSRSSIYHNSVTYSARSIDWKYPDKLADVIVEFEPEVILHTASLQSRWSLNKKTAWAQVVLNGGYGLSIALQAALHHQTWHSIQMSGTSPIFINACYPDLVNAVGYASGVRTFCGIGNVAIVAEYLVTRLRASRESLRVLAGHVDVELMAIEGQSRLSCPRAWIGDQEVEPSILRSIPPLVNDETLNSLNAAISGRMIGALLGGTPLSLIHVPGGNGLIGGAPMSFDGKKLRLALPSAISAHDAARWNHDRAVMDGASIEGGNRIVFSPKAQSALHPFSADLAKGFHISDLREIARAFVDLRSRLSA